MTSKSQLMVQWNLHVTQGISVNHLLYPCFHMEFLRSLCEAFLATWCPTLDGRHVSEKSASKTHWFNLVQLLITSSRFYFQIEKQTLEPQKLASLLPLRCAFFLAISLQFWGPVGQPSQSYLLAFRAFSMYKVVCPCWAAPCIALIQATNLKILKETAKAHCFWALDSDIFWNLCKPQKSWIRNLWKRPPFRRPTLFSVGQNNAPPPNIPKESKRFQPQTWEPSPLLRSWRQQKYVKLHR